MLSWGSVFSLWGSEYTELNNLWMQEPMKNLSENETPCWSGCVFGRIVASAKMIPIIPAAGYLYHQLFGFFLSRVTATPGHPSPREAMKAGLGGAGRRCFVFGARSTSPKGRARRTGTLLVLAVALCRFRPRRLICRDTGVLSSRERSPVCPPSGSSRVTGQDDPAATR